MDKFLIGLLMVATLSLGFSVGVFTEFARTNKDYTKQTQLAKYYRQTYHLYRDEVLGSKQGAVQIGEYRP